MLNPPILFKIYKNNHKQQFHAIVNATFTENYIIKNLTLDQGIYEFGEISNGNISLKKVSGGKEFPDTITEPIKEEYIDFEASYDILTPSEKKVSKSIAFFTDTNRAYAENIRRKLELADKIANTYKSVQKRETTTKKEETKKEAQLKNLRESFEAMNALNLEEKYEEILENFPEYLSA